jgi:oligopeptide transport system substrate-binding protein
MSAARFSSRLLLVTLAVATTAACSTAASDSMYFGSVDPPEGQHLRYTSGPEPESLDPQVGTTQPEARIYLALYDGLTDYDPKTGDVAPGLAERWEALEGNTVFVFHLRKAQWSDGQPITAHDFVYTIRRGLAPAFAAQNAYMAGEILYAQGYNEKGTFARNPRTGQFVMWPGKATGVRLVVPADPVQKDALLKAEPGLGEALRGTEAVPVRAEDIGFEAIDDYTLRVRAMQPIPYLPGLMAHQFFRPVPRRAVEKHGQAWTKPGNLIASGPFVLDTWRPYDRIVVKRNPKYWDAAAVKLDEITFYTIEEMTTKLNLYKAGELDAVYNHSVPSSWYDTVKGLRDYMNEPELAIEYYMFNTTQAPMNDIRVRRAFNAAVNKDALARLKRSAKVLTGFVPQGLFAGYPYPKGDAFDVARARALLAEAGYRGANGEYDPSRFPSEKVEMLYNTLETNRQVAEFLQAQWRQNLGITVQLRNMEFRTFVNARNNLEYRGLARSGWVGDYIDPVTFLDLFSTAQGNNGTGWFVPEYAEIIRAANRESDPMKRYAILARAEAYLLEAQPIVPLFIQGTNWLKKPYVMGMYANPVTLHPWKYVYIEHDRSKWN